MKQAKRPVALMTVAQVICALAIPLTSFFALPPLVSCFIGIQQVDLFQRDNTLIVFIFAFLFCLRELTLCLCLAFVEVEAFRLCGRMKQSSAFSPLNVTGLGRITIALGVAGLVSLLGNSIVPFLLTGLPEIAPVVQYLLLPFTLLTLALMARAVQVLMRRAVDMQEETDLTI